MSSSKSSSRTVLLPDELVLEIISRLGTVGEVVRCSSLLSKRWRHAWRSIGCGVLDFDKSDEVLRLRNNSPVLRSITDEEKRRFANRVDQALASLLHCRQNMDGLRIGFNLAGMEGVLSRWVEFGLTKRVKELSLSSYILYYNPSLRFFSPEFLAKHDLSRLQVLEFYGLMNVSQEAVDFLLSNCPSLQHLALRSCHIRGNGGREAVIRVHHSRNNNNLQCLELDELVGLDRIELIHAPRLHTFKFRSRICDWQIEFGDDLPRLEEALLPCRRCLLPWSGRDMFSKFAPRLQRLGLHVAEYDFVPHLAATPRWLRFEKLRVLDLFLHIDVDPPSFLECTVLLRAAPMLRELSVWFEYSPNLSIKRPRWKRRRDLVAEWKHPSLEVLQLHGVHPKIEMRGTVFDFRGCQLELAAYVIMSAPSLTRVVIDTRHRDPVRDCVGKTRLCDPIDAHVGEAKMELEMQLQGRSASPHINFIYQ